MKKLLLFIFLLLPIQSVVAEEFNLIPLKVDIVDLVPITIVDKIEEKLVACNDDDLLIAMGLIAGGGGAGATGCETVVQQDTTGGSSGIFGDASVYRRSGSLTTTKAYTICKITVHMKKLGSPSGNVNLKLYNDSGGFPTGSALATASETLTEGDLTTSMADYTFTISYPLSNATRYHFSAESDTLNDVSNKFYIDYYNEGTEKISYYDTAWSGGDTSAIFYHIAYE